MERYAGGDQAAFGALYDELAPKLYRYLLKAAHNEATAEDLLQQTFLRLHDARGRFQTGMSVEPWAYAIARRLFIDWQRRNKFVVVPQGDMRFDDVAGTEPDADAMLRARQLSDRLNLALDGLSAPQREAFLLIREQGLSMAEAAEILGTTVMAVKLRSHRAYENLRRVFDDLDPENGGGQE